MLQAHHHTTSALPQSRILPLQPQPQHKQPHPRQRLRCNMSSQSATLAGTLATPLDLQPRTCYLVGVGPGTIDYCTVKALRIIHSAQAIVYDDLGTQELLASVPAGVELVYVGKRGGQPSIKQPEINKILVELCQQGKSVVRLKGGCPSTFSRVSSEAAALAAAGLAYELVPGVSSATAAPVLAGFPLTDTQLAGSYAVISGHDAGAIDWSAYQHIPTLVVLMGGRQLGVIAQQLQATGWPADTPVAVVREAGLPCQCSWVCTLGSVQQELGELLPTLSPCVVVVGQVVGLPAVWKAHQQQQQQQPPPQAG